MDADTPFEVEVAYALPERQVLVSARVTPGATVEDALRVSGVLDEFPEIDLETQKVGVWGKVAPLDRVLAPRDRVEIYRPLLADPKEVRKLRAAQGKRMKKGGGDIADAAPEREA